MASSDQCILYLQAKEIFDLPATLCLSSKAAQSFKKKFFKAEQKLLQIRELVATEGRELTLVTIAKWGD